LWLQLPTLAVRSARVQCECFGRLMSHFRWPWRGICSIRRHMLNHVLPRDRSLGLLSVLTHSQLHTVRTLVRKRRLEYIANWDSRLYIMGAQLR
jgi:hypothetical protein